MSATIELRRAPEPFQALSLDVFFNGFRAGRIYFNTNTWRWGFCEGDCGGGIWHDFPTAKIAADELVRLNFREAR